MSNLSSIIEKIRKLQAKAKDEATTEAEAALFGAKVADLLIKHSLDPSILDDVKSEEMLVDTELYPRNYTHPWRTALANSVAKLYFCKVLIITTQRTTEFTNAKKRMLFIGKPHNRAISISMLEYFESVIARLAKEKYSGKSDIAAFERGCGIRLADRIIDLYNSLQRPPAGTDRSVPALYQTEEKAVLAVYERYRPREGKNVNLGSNSAALRAGMEAAKGISLSAQVKAAARQGTRLLN